MDMHINRLENKMGLILLLLVFAVYFSSLNTYFYSPIEWEIVKVAKDTVNNFTPPYIVMRLGESIESPMRILPRFSFMIDYVLWKANPIGWNFTNILIHMINTGLLLAFLKLLFRSNMFAFFSAVVFAIHPMNFHTVQWLGSRFNLLNMFFYLLSLFMFSKFIIKGQIRFYLASLFFAVCAYLSEEAALLLPASIILTDFLLFYSFPYPRQLRKDFFIKKVWIYLPYFIFSLSFVFAMFKFTHSAGFGSGALRLSSLMQEFPNAIFQIDWGRQIIHVFSTLFSPIFKDFLLAPWSICRYSGIRSGATFSTFIYNGVFYLIITFFIIKQLLLKSKIDLKIILFSVLWVITTAVIFLGSSLDFRDLLSNTRHLYISSIGFSCLLVYIFIGRGDDLLRKNKFARLQLIVFFLVLFNFVFRTEELISSAKMSTVKIKKFISEFTNFAVKLPEGSNAYFVNNVYDDGICAFIFSNYIQDIRRGNYYYGFSGTNFILEKSLTGKRPPPRQNYRIKDSNFDYSLLEIGQNDFLYGWGQDDKRDTLVDLAGVFNKRIKSPVSQNSILAIKSLKWQNLDLPSTLGPISMLLSPEFVMPVNLINKIKIFMKASIDYDAETRFIPLKNVDLSSLKIDPFLSLPGQFFPLKKPMIGFYWITDKDYVYDNVKLVSFPVEADGLLHEYEIYPQDCLGWVQGGDLIRFGFSSASVPEIFRLKIKVESVEIISSQIK